MSGKSPTRRTLELLREEGWTAEVVERWVPGANVRRDLFGLIDVLAIRGDVTLGVQVTTSSNLADRRKKALASGVLPEWVGSLRLFELHGWSKRGARGKPKLWGVTRERITARDLLREGGGEL